MQLKTWKQNSKVLRKRDQVQHTTNNGTKHCYSLLSTSNTLHPGAFITHSGMHWHRKNETANEPAYWCQTWPPWASSQSKTRQEEKPSLIISTSYKPKSRRLPLCTFHIQELTPANTKKELVSWLVEKLNLAELRNTTLELLVKENHCCPARFRNQNFRFQKCEHYELVHTQRQGSGMVILELRNMT